MPVFKSGEYEIQFPFEPYDVQKALMDKVIECLESRENGLLESPTGTGKTLSLLCASIAWQRKQKFSIQANRANQPFPELLETPFQSVFGKKNSNNNNAQAVFSVPKIIYSSRTHSQLSQAIQELKRSFYKDAKAIVLGSRDLLCVHEEVSRLPTSSAKIMACHIRVQHHTCGYYNNLSTKKDELLIRDQSVVDIEDIVRRGKANRFCPFFMSRDLVQEAEVVFMPYNYLLDPKLRSSHGIDLKNCVIILDEGHNVAKICEDAVSFEIKSTIIAQCIQELTKALNEFSEITQQGTEKALAKDLSLGSIIRLKQSFLQLEEELDKIKTNDEGTILPGQQLLSILFQNGFPPSSLTASASDLDSISTFLTGKSQDATGCDKFGSVLRILSSQSMFRNPTVFGESYKVFVQHEESKRLNSDIRSYSSTKSAKAKVFHFWCFNPAVGLENMMLYGPRCIVLASGTLSPMPFLQKELQIPFPIQLSNPHIIKDNQLLARVVTKGPENIRLSSSYQNRNDKNYLKSLGELIRQVCAVVPKGVLVFFPSYSVMEICKREWESTGLWNRMEQSKKILFEPRGKDNFKQTMDDYYAAVKSSSGACLMAVCRGKVSEGLDFTDDNGRAVIITGIPYSPARDPHVLAKQQYLNNKVSAGEKQCVSGAGWYQMEATRALNQAIGRIIRHVNDYGAILLCDERCAAGNVQQNLSGWVHDRLKTSDSFGDTIRDLSHFFGSSVQKERNELAKLMVRSTRPASQTAKAPSGTIEHAYQTPSAQELEDIYGSSECHVEYSQARKNESSSSQSQHVASSSQIKSRSRKHIKMTLEDLNTPVSSSKLVDFNAPVPVYPKPFAAFSQTTSPSSSTSWFQKPQKKKIKLASRNNAFSGGSSSSSALNQRQTSSEPLVNGRERSVVEFSTNDEFWAWVKVAAGARQGKFVRALKSFQASKDVQSLANELTDIFTPEYRKQLVGGLSGRKLISADAAKQLDLIICS